MSCKYCEGVEIGTVGKTYNDGHCNYAEIAWFTTDGPMLEVKTDGEWSNVYINNCPWCGDELKAVER